MENCYKVSWLEFDNQKETTKSVSILAKSDVEALKKIVSAWYYKDKHALDYIEKMEGNLESMKIQLIVFQIIIEDVVLEVNKY